MPHTPPLVVSPTLQPPPDWTSSERGSHVIHERAQASAFRLGFAMSVAQSLSDHPRWLDCRYLYNAEGSRIFEKITEQPEYYPTRCEEAILAQRATQLRELVGDVALVELGSGSSAKTRHLLRAWDHAGPSRYYPVDVSTSALEEAGAKLCAEFPRLHLEAIGAPYDHALPLLQQLSPLLLVFLGSTLGNLNEQQREQFLGQIARSLNPGDRFLLGIDLIKAPEVLEAAYNDKAGWSAKFTRNLFAHMNHELGSQVPLDAIEHVAYFNDRLERIEIYARCKESFTLEIPLLDQGFRLAQGEMILTEISCKFRPEHIAASCARHGMLMEEEFRDPQDRFAVLVLRRQPDPSPREELKQLLTAARARTLRIVAPLSEFDLNLQHDPRHGPISWDLGHLAEFEGRWLVRTVDEGGGPRERIAQELDLNPLYDPASKPRPTRMHLQETSDRSEVQELLERSRALVLERLLAAPLESDHANFRQGYVYRMVAQHEAQHQETILQALQLRKGRSFELPTSVRRPPQAVAPAEDSVLIPAGSFVMGTDDERAAYDNECPAHTRQLPDYRIDTSPVTNAVYLEFVQGGGYSQRDVWSDEGWSWLQAEQVTAPLHWEYEDAWFVRLFGRRYPLDPNNPVMHVNWYEADACARWLGKRLPREAEWEKAAAWDPEQALSRTFPWGEADPSRELANVDLQHLGPVVVGAYPQGASFYGCHQMLGDVWEWTASEFDAYPGFQTFPYREYSEVYFKRGYRVLRGGSWASAQYGVRNTVRNWDRPDRRQLFAGFRCAQDVEEKVL